MHTLHEEKKCIVGRRHLACRRELAEGEQSFRALCESTVRLRLALRPFHTERNAKKRGESPVNVNWMKSKSEANKSLWPSYTTIFY